MSSESFASDEDSSSMYNDNGLDTSLQSLITDSIDEKCIDGKKQKSLINQHKIQVMQKIKSKKLKKRLSENNGGDLHSEYGTCRSPKREQERSEQRALH